ncbi:hypothetical protein [Streptomyces sp. NPDC053720]|uniref:hypothetical protein n=1 Tax=Streptomyces sp. NPDC053720 TaxID=3154855 RepID=UPI003416D36E
MTVPTDVLALLCEEIGGSLDYGLAARRYAISGDRRALNGCDTREVVLQRDGDDLNNVILSPDGRPS